MGQFPQDGENGQNMAFFIFLALLWPNVLIFSTFLNCSEEILPVHAKNVFALALAHLEHYVLSSWWSEQCYNRQKLLKQNLSHILSGAMFNLECTTFLPIWPHYGHFGPKNSHIWPYLAIGSPSCPKLVEHWLNMVEHRSPHLGWAIWTPLHPPKWPWGASEGPQNGHF